MNFIKANSPNSSFLHLLLVVSICSIEFISVDAGEENTKLLAAANNEFALNLHKRLTSGSQENVFFSPLSLSTVFGMLYYGLKGESAKELRIVLGFEDAGLPDIAVHSSFHRLLSQASTSNPEKTYTLKSANTILADESLHVSPQYKTSVQDLYLSPVTEVNFAVDSQRVVEEVNKWVENNTRGKIQNVLKEIHPQTAMILLNVLYFKGKWKIPFHSRATKPAPFYNGGMAFGSKNVAMMSHTSALLPYSDFPDYQALELPYAGEHLTMLILLPKHLDGLTAIEQNLTNTMLRDIRQRMTKKKVEVHLPRFKMEFNRNLSPDLQRLGMRKIFRSGSEDFSGISERNSKKLFVTDVVHKSKIEVNEEGSEAAASTTSFIVFVRLVKKVVFNADHPFLFFIWDKRNDLILFMGRLSNF